MSSGARMMSGILLLTIPTIQYGGYFLLGVLSGKHRALALNEFQKAMFRAGHAHAGVIVILSIVCQLLLDHVALSSGVIWSLRVGFPLSAILISGGFFASALGRGVTAPTRMIGLLYLGAAVLALSLILTGIGLLWA
jgi:hypothetical protein